MRRSSEVTLVTQVRSLARQPAFLLFLANFGIGKGLAFFGPIVLSFLLSSDLYGGFEFALAGAQIIALGASLGVPAAAMQLVLMRSSQSVKDLLSGVAALVGVAAFMAAGACALSKFELRWSLLAVFAVLCAVQQSGVAYGRAFARPNFNVWIDHSPTLVAVVIAIFLWSVDLDSSMQAMTLATALVAAAAILGAGILAFRLREPLFTQRLIEASRIGIPIVGAGIVSAWIVSSARIYNGLFLREPDVYAYALTFRVANVLALFHALVMTAFAARMYRMPTRRFDPLAAQLIVILAALTLALIVIQPGTVLSHFLSTDKAEILKSHPAIAFIPVQAFLWVAGAIVEQRVARSRRAGRVAVLNALLAATIGVVLFGMFKLGLLSFGTLVTATLVQQALAVASLHAVLLLRGVPLSRTAATTIAAGLTLTLAAAIRYAAGSI